MTTNAQHTSWWATVGHIIAVAGMMAFGFIFGVVALMTAPENFTGTAHDEITDLGLIRFLIATLLLLLLPWYRKIPLALMICGAFYAVALQGDPYVLAIGLTVWLVRATRPWHWIVTGFGLVAIVINIVWHLLAVLRLPTWIAAETPIVLVLTAGFITLGLVLGIGLLTRQRRKVRQVENAVDAVAHDRDIISTQMTRQTEREYLAREVHDTLAQRLTALSLQTGQLQKNISPADDQLAEALSATKQYSDQALKDLRNLVSTLRQHGEPEGKVPSVAPAGFTDLRALIDDAQDQGLHVTPYIMLNGYDTADDELQRAVLRITQEAFTNAMRHSADQQITMQLQGQPGEGLQLRFTNSSDQQRQFAAGTGTGLLGITERAKLLGGTAQTSHQDGEFSLSVTLPWRQPADTP